jgi:NDP-sugar pyrophosphorylase family protein
MPNVADAILLCGGAGLRLRSVTGKTPKALANIAGRPFLALVLSQLRRHGFQRVILAVGYGNDAIRSHFGDRAFDLQLRYSIEAIPLGTGGALRKAVDLIESDSALIMNGDSYTDADLTAFAADYRESGADASILVVPADGRIDCGLVSVDPSGKVMGFKEKQSSVGTQHVNAGIYMASKNILGDIPTGVQVSLEEELFPQWLVEGRYLRAFRHPGACIDIGTAERYRSAQDSLANAELGANLSGPEGH